MHRLLVSEIRQSILNLKSSKSPRIDGIQSYLKLHVINFYHFWKYCSINFTILQSSRKIGLYQLLHSFLKREIQVYLTTMSVFVYSQLLVKFTQISWTSGWQNGLMKIMLLAKNKRATVNLFSTFDNLFCPQTIVTNYLRNKGGRFYAIFVDFEKAFDRVDRNALWTKLQSLRLSSKMNKMLRSIYCSVKSCVKT